MRPLRSGHSGDRRLLGAVRWRLVAWSAGSTLVLLLALGSALYVSTAASLAATGSTQLEERAETLAAFVTGQRPDVPFGPDSETSPFGRTIFGGPASGTLAIVVDRNGAIVGPRPPGVASLPVAEGVGAALEDGRNVRDAALSDTPVRVLSEAIATGGERYVIQVIQDRSAEVRTLNTLLTVLVVGGLAVLVAAAGLGFVYAGRALVPIRESLRRQREFTADASHELRTPLAVLRTGLDYLRRHAGRRFEDSSDIVDDMDAEVSHLTELVDDLLLLARSDSGVVELRSEPLDLADVAGEALQSLRGFAERRRVVLHLEATPATVRGDPLRLRQLMAILVDNAIRHSPAGRVVAVTIAQSNAGVEVTVEDEGRGIRSQDLPYLFDRFWRAADAPPGGTGLGLSIAKWIAEHHGGALTAANRPTGGAQFVLHLPRA